MKRTLAVSLFVLATFTWTFAQTSGSSTSGAQQPPSASSQSPDASSSQTPPGSAGQSSSQSGSPAGSQSQAANAPITEGCLGGTNGNYTLTDKAGTSYKLSFPSNANVSVLSSHVGESVAVMGDTQGDAKSGQTINVSKIGRGTTTCAGSPSGPAGSTGSSAPPQTPKQ
jgi:hypothetical protein